MISDFGGVFLGIFTLLILGICIASAFIFIGIDETVQADRIYASLPITRSTLVHARYVSAFLMTVISFTLILLTCLGCINLFHKTDPVFSLFLSWRGITAMLSFLWLILSFMFPFIMKMGGSKGMTAVIVTQVSLVIAGPVIKFFFKIMSGILEFDIGMFMRFLQNLLSWFVGLKAVYAYFLVLAMLSVVILGSIMISVRFYQKRDL